MASKDITDDMREQARYYLLPSLRAAGFGEEQVQRIIAQIPKNHPDKGYYIQQYLDSVPANQRMASAKRLGSNSEKQIRITSHFFMAFYERWEQGYFNSFEKIDHPDYIARQEARERELREALVADGIEPDKVEDVIVWADVKARDCEKNGTPMYRGYNLTLIFLLRLLKGTDTL